MINQYSLSHTINMGFESPEKIFFLLKHLDRYYLQLSEVHEEFRITNGDCLFKGAQIINQESANGQSVRHLYTVEHFIDGQYVQLISNQSVVKKKLCGCNLSIQLKTIVEFDLKKSEFGETLITCKINLIFPNKFSFFASRLSRTEQIWSAHLRDEMAGGKRVLSSEAFALDYSREGGER